MPLFNYDLGIDLGTSSTRIFMKGRGIILDEPTIALVEYNSRGKKKSLAALGRIANQSVGSDMQKLKCIFPVTDGVITDSEIAVKMLQAFIASSAGSSHFTRPRVFITYPCNLSKSNRQMLRTVCDDVGVSRTVLISKPFAAAAGGGLPVYDAKGTMIVDIGAGTMDIAVTSLGGLAINHSINYGGNKMNDAIIAYFRAKKMIDLSWKTAEDIKLDLGSQIPAVKERACTISSKYVSTGLPIETTVTTSEVYEALKDSREAILNSISYVLKFVPLAMLSDIMEKGIYITGGVSQMPGLREMIYDKIKIPVNPAVEPYNSAIYGLRNIINNLDVILKRGTSSFLEID